MPNKSWNFSTGGAPKVPANLILGLKEGVSLEPGWSLWTTANNYFLTGTTNNTLVGTTLASSTVSMTSNTRGGHSSGGGIGAYEHCSGSTSGCPSSCGDWSWNGSSYGDHHHHLTGGYIPDKNQIKLIQASDVLPFPIGGLGFSTTNLPDQVAFSVFNNNPSGHLFAGSSSAVVSGSNSLTFGSGSINSHNHHTSYNTRVCSGVASGYPASINSSSYTHDHSTSGLSITADLKRAALRAWEIVDADKMDGIIGMWTGATIPDGWELVTEVDDRLIQCSSVGSAAAVGAGTLSVSSGTNNKSHSHSTSGTAGYVIVGTGYHTSLSHNHSVSNSHTDWKPAQYFIKFIRYIG